MPIVTCSILLTNTSHHKINIRVNVMVAYRGVLSRALSAMVPSQVFYSQVCFFHDFLGLSS